MSKFNLTEWCRKNNVSRPTVYRWLKKFHGDNPEADALRPDLDDHHMEILRGRYSRNKTPVWTVKEYTPEVVGAKKPYEPHLDRPPAPPLMTSTGSIAVSEESELATLKRENKMLLRALGDQHRFEEAALRAIERPKPFPFTARDAASKKDKTAVSAVLCLGDWHIGDLVRASEIQNLNEFNYSIAERRVEHLVSDVLRWVEVQRNCYHIETLWILVLGDMVSGGIHLELQTDEEFPPPVQCVKSGRLLSWAIRTCVPHFQRTRVRFLRGDNHSRTTLKPRNKRKTEFSLGHMVSALCQAELPIDVEYHEPAGTHDVVKIQNHRFLLQHGDTIRSYGLTPDAAIEKAMMEEQVVRRGQNEIDCMIIGHFHRPSFKPYLITNGSLCGRTEYEHSKRFRYQPPCQVSFLVHPKHGPFSFIPWRLLP